MADQWTAATARGVVVTGVCLGDDAWLEIDEIALACQVEPHFVELLIDEGMVQPARTDTGWRFGSDELARVRRIRRLQRDFDANLQSIAVMLDLLDEVDRLQAALRRVGIKAL
ncbi:MAG: chaperone modulator CbpM [Burkholderiaceae bacterium]